MSIARYATRNPRPSTPANRDQQGDLLDDVLVAVLRIVWLGLRLILARPLLPATGVTFLYIYAANGAAGLLVAVAIPMALAALWALVHPQSFRSWVWQPIRAGVRRWWRYSRQWQPVLVAHGLAVNRGQAVPMVPPPARWRPLRPVG